MPRVNPPASVPPARSGGALIRPLTADDLPRLVPLHRSAFGAESTLSESALVRHFREVFLEGPWARPGASDSLVCVDADDSILGFIGVFRSRWVFDRAPCSVAITSQLMVDESRAHGTVAIQLLRHIMAGPYDLVLADGASDAARRLWSTLGGDWLAVASLEWVRPLRPMRTLSDIFLRRAGVLSRLRPMVSWAAAVPDALAARMRPNHFDRPIDGLREDPLHDRSLGEYRRAFASRFRLAPQYSDDELGWLLTQVHHRRLHGDVRTVLLRGEADEVLGWYLYHWRRGSNARVIEVQSTPSGREQVLRHLFRDAWLRGATAVTGSARHDLLPALGSLWCYLRSGGPWTIAFSRRVDVRLALHSGDAWFSRLDGEDWMQFLGEAHSFD